MLRGAFLTVSLALAVTAVATLALTHGQSSSVINVRAYGAVGNGDTDDTAAFQRAIKAAVIARRPLLVPAGVYRVRSLRLPDGLALKGAGRRSAWLKGKLTFGSNDVVRDLKIGDAGMSAVHNRNGATNTVFDRCRFRGGGGRAWTYVVDLGSGSACNHITFKDCEVERNLGVESGGDQGFNDITVWVAQSGPVSDITFNGCHIGVSNGQGGHDTGSPRFDIECYTGHETSGHGWQNITLRNCTLEAADHETADFSDEPGARASGVLIEGCTFQGGGKWTLNFEMPQNVVVRNNTIYRGSGSWGSAICVTDRAASGFNGPGAVFTGNLIDYDFENGVAQRDAHIVYLLGDGNQFTGNTIRCHYGTTAVVLLNNAHNNVVTGNTFEVGTRTVLGSINSSSRNTVSPNTVN